MTHSRLLLRVVLLTLLALGATGGWLAWRRAHTPVPQFLTTTVARGEVVQSVTATGSLAAVTSVDVSSQISGLITEVAVDYNTPVKTGDILARIDPATYQSRLAQAEAQLANTTANVRLVRLTAERTRELRAKNLVSQQDLDQAEAELAQAEAQLQNQQATVNSAKVDLSRCTIVAPIDGIVLDRATEVGKTVAASLNAPTLFTIVNNLAQMEIAAAVAEADIGSVKEGQDVTFTVDAFPGRQFRGVVTQIRNAPQTTNNVVTYATIIEVNNADLKLKPGMTANVAIVVARQPDALRVGNSALRARIPEALLRQRAPLQTSAKPASPPPLSDEEQHKIVRDLFREVGVNFAAGGPPSPEAREKVRQLARERGLNIDWSRLRRHGGTEAANEPPAPVFRTVYRLQGADPATATIEPVQVQIGITDGTNSEVLSGLQDGDILITTVSLGSSGSASGGTNPFAPSPMGGGPRR